MKSKITVMGSYVSDLMARADHLPEPGETVKGNMFKLGPGGKGSNQAVAAHKAGGDVTLVTKVGKDIFGKHATDFYEKAGMNTSFVFEDNDIETGSALIMVDENTSQNSILVTLGACGNITEDEINQCESILKESDILLTQLETNLEAIEQIVEMSKKHDLLTILNPAPIQSVSDEFLSKIDIITPNEVEASILTGVKVKTYDDAREAANVLLGKGIKNVIITMGSQGVYIKTEEKEKIIPRHEVDAVDTTGAGDAFNGGFVAALAEGKDIFEAAEFGNVVGALSVTKIGTAPAMPTREDIDNFINR
jgi:ribokinase